MRKVLEEKVFVQPMESGFALLNSDKSTTPIGCNDHAVIDSIPGPQITSSRGAADTTAGGICFSTPSAQVRIPVGDLVFHHPVPHLCSHYTSVKICIFVACIVFLGIIYYNPLQLFFFGKISICSHLVLF